MKMHLEIISSNEEITNNTKGKDEKEAQFKQK